MLSIPIRKLFLELSEQKNQADWSSYDGPRFMSNEITSRMGSWYEKVRFAVDYQEEHAVRRIAIERLLRRLLVTSDKTELAHKLLQELVRTGYVGNDILPEAIAPEVQVIIDKYIALCEQLPMRPPVWQLYAAIEIEHTLFPVSVNELVFEAMFQSLKNRLKPRENDVLSNDDFCWQLYIACRKHFFKETPQEIGFGIFLAENQGWSTITDPNDTRIKTVADGFFAQQATIETKLKNRLHKKIASRIHNERIFFSLLRDIAERYGVDGQQVLEDQEKREAICTDLLEKKYTAHKQTIVRSGTRANTLRAYYKSDTRPGSRAAVRNICAWAHPVSTTRD